MCAVCKNNHSLWHILEIDLSNTTHMRKSSADDLSVRSHCRFQATDAHEGIWSSKSVDTLLSQPHHLRGRACEVHVRMHGCMGWGWLKCEHSELLEYGS